MNNFVCQQLQYIITQYGRAVCDDHRRCEALLRDLCPENKREVNVLIIALKSKVAEDLMKITDAMPKELMLSRLVKRLEDDYGFAEKFSRWAVESWAFALGISLPSLPSPAKRTEKTPVPPPKESVKEGKNVSNPKYQLRNKPITVPENKESKVFKLKQDSYGFWRPREYVENDFRDNGDGTITDHTTDLVWQKAGSPNYMPYEDVPAYIEKLNCEKFAGYSDWRLPTIDELKSLITKNEQPNNLHINPIFNEKQSSCWTSDQSFGGAPRRKSKMLSWHVCFEFGRAHLPHPALLNHARAVRSAQ